MRTTSEQKEAIRQTEEDSVCGYFAGGKFGSEVNFTIGDKESVAFIAGFGFEVSESQFSQSADGGTPLPMGYYKTEPVYEKDVLLAWAETNCKRNLEGGK